MNGLLSEARRDALHAEMKEAAAQIYTAMGYDPFSADITGTESIETIAQSLQVLWEQRSHSPGVKSVQLRGVIATPESDRTSSVSP
jgi:hypothetical protein